MEKNGPTDILTYQEGHRKDKLFKMCIRWSLFATICAWSNVECKDNQTTLLCRAESDMVSIWLLDACTEGDSLDCKLHPIM